MEMLDYEFVDNTGKFRSEDNELIGIINYDTVFSMFIVDKENNTATVTLNKQELEQIYSVIGEFLNN